MLSIGPGLFGPQPSEPTASAFQEAVIQVVKQKKEEKDLKLKELQEFEAILALLDGESRRGLPLMISLRAADRALTEHCQRVDQLHKACMLRCCARAQLRASVTQLYAHLAYYVRPSPKDVRAKAVELHQRTMNDPDALDRLDTALDQAVHYGTLYEGDPSDPEQPLGLAFPSEMSGVEVYGYKGEWIRYVAELIPETRDLSSSRPTPLSVFGYLWACNRLQDKLGAASTPSVPPNSYRAAPAVLPMAAVGWRDATDLNAVVAFIKGRML